ILLGENATFIERHAASEMAKYIETASGARLEITSNRPDINARNIILLGRTETNPIMMELARNGLFRLSPEQPGLDGFIIKTVSRNGKNYLLVGGSMDRGTLYGVYHFLEKVLRAGFFWESERIPRQNTIRFGRIDIAEKPRFQIRQYPQGCVFTYNSRQWDIADWKREIDWMCKHKLNRLYVPSDAHSPLADVNEIVKYARSVGLDTIFMLKFSVDEEFRKKHPAARYLSIRYGTTPYMELHPADPLFVSECGKNIAAYVKKYGKGNTYRIEPYGERSFDQLSPAEREELKIDYARSVIAAVQAADPEGQLFMWSWAFSTWNKNLIRRFLECFPDDNFYICDSYAETWPIYKNNGYFYGKQWGFSVLRYFGGDDGMKGNLADLISRMKEVAEDPKAGRCIAFFMEPELITYNSIYFELATQLGWNPQNVTLENYLRDYALRRYGPERADGMLAVLQELAKSVYGNSPGSEALYQFPRYEGSEGNMYHGHFSFWNIYKEDVYALALSRAVRRSINNVPSLQAALQMALAQRDERNPCYLRDLTDIARQGLAEVFNCHFLAMQRAFYERQPGPLTREIAALKVIMEGAEELVFNSGLYRLQPLEEKIMRYPSQAERELDEIRNTLTTFYKQRWLLDYQGKDYYELIKYYYRPRLWTYLDEIARAAEAGKWSMQDAAIDRILENAGRQWANCVFEPESGERDLFRSVEKAGQLMREFQPERAPFLLEGAKLKICAPVWEDRFAGVADWKKKPGAAGEMISNGQTAIITAPREKAAVFSRDLDISIAAGPLFNFRFNRVTHGHASIWVTWLDAGGQPHRIRVWRDVYEGIAENSWIEIQLDLQQMFQVFATPAKLVKIEIENTAGTVTQWERMAFGKKAGGIKRFLNALMSKRPFSGKQNSGQSGN
ncbi:MAG: alpha-N-acetylglucosaminidase TIM-barrel domain-containing protein, partial [Kiritimatiellae bacterium]|nr:alpha-N-acetylglucosaminidase TIM-barrel domain-containing protein [Kiritimatiellia bacterium]